MRKLAAGNWKMNGLRAGVAEVAALIAAQPSPACEMLLCPPSTLIAAMAKAAEGSALKIGAQDCHAQAFGPHTGDLAAAMLADAGASHVILGHSERRADHGETDALVRAKAQAAIAAGLVAIICLGETAADRDAGKTLGVIGAQLDGSVPASARAAQIVIAYEPIWAIGTGRIPEPDQIAEVHAFVRARLAGLIGAEAGRTRILYGGSVTPLNAARIFALPNVDGALVGGASLKAADFAPIVEALSAA